MTGTVAMSANAAIGSNSGTGTVNGVVSGTGFTLTKVGVGQITLGGANTYTGGTTIGNGALQLNNNTAAGTGAITLVTGGATNATKLLINGGYNFILTGAEELSADVFNIYPNPNSKGSLQLNIGKAWVGGFFSITDVIGKEVMKSEVDRKSVV